LIEDGDMGDLTAEPEPRAVSSASKNTLLLLFVFSTLYPIRITLVDKFPLCSVIHHQYQ